LTVVYGNPQVDDQRCESAEGRGSYKNIRQRCRTGTPFRFVEAGGVFVYRIEPMRFHRSDIVNALLTVIVAWLVASITCECHQRHHVTIELNAPQVF
jgi:hypothetical protein